MGLPWGVSVFKFFFLDGMGCAIGQKKTKIHQSTGPGNCIFKSFFALGLVYLNLFCTSGKGMGDQIPLTL